MQQDYKKIVLYLQLKKCHKMSLWPWYHQMLKIVIGIDYKNKTVWGENILKASILQGEIH